MSFAFAVKEKASLFSFRRCPQQRLTMQEYIHAKGFFLKKAEMAYLEAERAKLAADPAIDSGSISSNPALLRNSGL
ncbi:MAG: hypothetical protein J7497_10075 [Chitinophagaceae bacterium]|nr:hypothetical protein [Chitinophagaceae bacterium]